MGTFDLIMVICAVAGFMMVGGGIFLLSKGAITLNMASKQDGITIDLVDKIKVSTTNPGLAFFVLGIFTFVIAGYMMKEPSLEIKGKIQNTTTNTGLNASNITIRIFPDKTEILNVSSDGGIIGEVHPHANVLSISIEAPGHEPYSKHITSKDAFFGVAELGDITLKKVIEMPEINPANVTNIEEELPAFNEVGNF